MHAREHQQFNDLLRAQGYLVDKMDALVRRILGYSTPRQSAGIRLAVTCTLEHFTTIFSTAMLRSPEVQQAMSGKHARLWCWHWVEELEHKAVAFDVYRAIGGRYFRRNLVMVATTLVMWSVAFYIMLKYMAHDRCLLSLREWWNGVVWAILRPGMLGGAVLAYFAYYRRDYHPSQDADTILLARWRARLEQR